MYNKTKIKIIFFAVQETLHVSNIIDNNNENSSTTDPIESLISQANEKLESFESMNLTNMRELIAATKIQKKFREFLYRNNKIIRTKKPIVFTNNYCLGIFSEKNFEDEDT